MWQNSPTASRSPWVQQLKDLMKKPESDTSEPGKGYDVGAETEELGDESSDGIPDHFMGVIDEPEFASDEEVRVRADTSTFPNKFLYLRFTQKHVCSLVPNTLLPHSALRRATSTAESGQPKTLQSLAVKGEMWLILVIPSKGRKGMNSWYWLMATHRVMLMPHQMVKTHPMLRLHWQSSSRRT